MYKIPAQLVQNFGHTHIRCALRTKTTVLILSHASMMETNHESNRLLIGASSTPSVFENQSLGRGEPAANARLIHTMNRTVSEACESIPSSGPENRCL